MNRNTLLAALLAMSVAAGPVLAQGRGDRRDEAPDRQGQRPDRGHPQNQGQGQGQRERAMHDRGRSDPPGHRGRRDDSREDERGAGPEHNFHRGDRLPREYHSRYYVVDDWRAHRLNPPPRGYHWVQNGSDYLLVAIASGIIAQLILGH
jgi:Ni/Co efflux regulator RcnB